MRLQYVRTSVCAHARRPFRAGPEFLAKRKSAVHVRACQCASVRVSVRVGAGWCALISQNANVLDSAHGSLDCARRTGSISAPFGRSAGRIINRWRQLNSGRTGRNRRRGAPSSSFERASGVCVFEYIRTYIRHSTVRRRSADGNDNDNDDALSPPRTLTHSLARAVGNGIRACRQRGYCQYVLVCLRV